MRKVRMQVAGAQRTVYLERFISSGNCPRSPYNAYNARVYVNGNDVVSGEFRQYNSGVRRFIPTTARSKQLLATA